jgi:hypothetical protein
LTKKWNRLTALDVAAASAGRHCFCFVLVRKNQCEKAREKARFVGAAVSAEELKR